MSTDKKPFATFHKYEVATTSELNKDQITRLGQFLETLAEEAGGQYHGAMVLGKSGQFDVDNFKPVYLNELLGSGA